MNPTPPTAPTSTSTKPAPGPSKKDVPGLTYRPRDARDAVTQRWTRRERKNLYGNK